MSIGIKGYFITNFLEIQCLMRTSWQANVIKWHAHIYLNTWCKQNSNACCHFPRHWATTTFLYSYKLYSERAKKTRFSIKLRRDTDLWRNANQIVYIMNVSFVRIKFKKKTCGLEGSFLSVQIRSVRHSLSRKTQLFKWGCFWTWHPSYLNGVINNP